MIFRVLPVLPCLGDFSVHVVDDCISGNRLIGRISSRKRLGTDFEIKGGRYWYLKTFF